MIRFKVHFFLFYGAMGAILPYEPLIAKDLIGISATSYATVYSSQLFITVFSKTALCYIADYFKRVKIMISLLIIVHCLCFLSILVIPKIDVSANLKQNSTLLNLFEEGRNGTELYIISLSSGKVCNRSSNDSNLLSMTIVERRHSKNGENVTQISSEIICIAKSNFTDKTLCFELGNNTKEGELLKTHLPLCCSTYSMQLEQYKTQMKTITNFYYLHSLNPEISNDSVTASKPCTATFSDESKSTEKYLNMNSYKTYQFWLYACIMIIAGTCSSSAFTLSDTICCESVQKFNRDFGRQRMYSVISWGIFAPLGGLLCDLTNGFFSTWILMAVTQILVIWNLYKMDLVVPQFSQNLTKDVGTVLKSSTFLAFNAGSFVSGIWGGVVWYYLVWFISTLGASTFLCGLVPYVQCFVGEIPLMFFSGWIIEKVGHFNILSLSLLAYAVRSLWYSYLKNPWLVLPMEITNGITYGLFYSVAASFGKLSSEPGTETTTLSIIFSTHEGLGAGLGCILGGIGFDYLGGQVTFFYLSLLAFGSTFLSVCGTLFVSKLNVVNTDISSSSKKSYNTMITNFCLFKPSRDMLSIEPQALQKTNPVGSSGDVHPDKNIILVKFEKK
ncbi:major facilitator superfamily domain-containing protein 6-like [Parasteatoda tepidariorum]|uniref:major facilitator superfamily domain-containing protein 6-like n=1 Tax=Parasteatoda tepidariorum TaxID=114398 RepID=UPI0039BD7DC0